MTAYYNEIDPFAAQWLRNLIIAGLIAPGDVDERSIEDVAPSDLKNYTQCHFFAGIGVWSYALRQAGWGDDKQVWTGSCPCQPFSTACKGIGFADERHLWPAFFHLIECYNPSIIFGEQVASKDGLQWIDLVFDDLEGSNYTTWAADLCAPGVGAPHIRQRLFWVAYSNSERFDWIDSLLHRKIEKNCVEIAGSGAIGSMADTHNKGLERWGESECKCSPEFITRSDGLAFAQHPNNGFWSNADWVYCRDEKFRPIESGTFPLVDGTPSHVGRIRAYGNAIVAPLAEVFIKSAMECLPT